jgi:hypothetical protein
VAAAESAIGLVILVAWIYVAFLSGSLSFLFCKNVRKVHNVFYRKKVSLPTNLANFHNKAHLPKYSKYTIRFAPDSSDSTKFFLRALSGRIKLIQNATFFPKLKCTPQD